MHINVWRHDLLTANILFCMLGFLTVKWFFQNHVVIDGLNHLSSIGLLNLETMNSNVLASLSACTQILENLKFNSINSQEGVLDRVLFIEDILKFCLLSC